jgi:hypothetical protein
MFWCGGCLRACLLAFGLQDAAVVPGYCEKTKQPTDLNSFKRTFCRLMRCSSCGVLALLQDGDLMPGYYDKIKQQTFSFQHTSCSKVFQAHVASVLWCGVPPCLQDAFAALPLQSQI